MRPGTPDAVAAEIRRHRYSSTTEEELQAGLAVVLESTGLVVAREVSFGAVGRIDLYLPDLRIGIEVKTDGSPADACRQVLRYAESGHFAALVVVSSRVRLGALIPPEHAGTPITIFNLWESSL